MSKQPQVPLDHRVRRCILRRLHKDFAPHAARELSEDLGVETREIKYHGKVLASWRIVKQAEGPEGLFFESLVSEDPKVIAVLISTQAEDEPE